MKDFPECRTESIWGWECIFLEGLSQIRVVLECRRKCIWEGEGISIGRVSEMKVFPECRNEGTNSNS